MRKRRRPPHSYASLIAQAILTSQDQKMTLREIYEWVQTRYPHLYEANETGWQNTIRHNLSLNRCFRKVPRTQDNGKKGTKGGYWTVDVDQLNNTNFGRQILDSGFLGSIEYWHHEQQQQQLRHVMAPSSSTSSLSNLSSSSSSSSIQQQSQSQRINQTVEEIDFNSLMPFYSTQQVQQQQRHYTTDGLDSQRQNGFFTTSTNTNNTNDNNKMKRSFDSTNTNSSMGSTSSKTSSVRGSTSPNSPETDMSTPTFQSLTFQRQQPNGSQVVHHTNKLDMDPLLNPSLMRVNNILN
ncbi:fork head domain-containing protein [Cunninghamella echinulata]|nr:fork head domain-containing protein [Cunninghamella echinulata]